MKVDISSLIILGVIVLLIAAGVYRVTTRTTPVETFSGIVLPQKVRENLPYAMLGKWGGEDKMFLGEGYYYTFSKKILTAPDGNQHKVIENKTRYGKRVWINIDVR
jgi:hypothetical protein